MKRSLGWVTLELRQQLEGIADRASS